MLFSDRGRLIVFLLLPLFREFLMNYLNDFLYLKIEANPTLICSIVRTLSARYSTECRNNTFLTNKLPRKSVEY